MPRHLGHICKTCRIHRITPSLSSSPSCSSVHTQLFVGCSSDNTHVSRSPSLPLAPPSRSGRPVLTSAPSRTRLQMTARPHHCTCARGLGLGNAAAGAARWRNQSETRVTVAAVPHWPWMGRSQAGRSCAGAVGRAPQTGALEPGAPERRLTSDPSAHQWHGAQEPRTVWRCN